MKHRIQWLSLTVLLFSAVFLWRCTVTPTSSDTGQNNGGPGASSNGHYSISSPALGTVLRNDTGTTYIRWTSSTSDASYLVNIELFRNDSLISVLFYGLSNTGSRYWTVYSTYNLPTSDKYRVRIVNYSDTTLYDFSNYFKIRSAYSGTITVTVPKADTVLPIYTTLNIQWTSTGTIGNNVGIQLFADSVPAGSIVSLVSNSSHSYLWPSVATSKGAGTKYRIRVSSFSDSSICGYSGYFTISISGSPGNTNNGNVTITSPFAGMAFQSSSTLSILWAPGTVDSLTPVSLGLYRNDTLVSTLATYTANDGAFSTTLGTYPSSDKYRVKITSYLDSSKYDYSGYFKIYSGYYGAIALTAPLSGAVTRIDSSLYISWTYSGSIGSYVNIRLYADTALAYSILTDSYNYGYYNWPQVRTNLGSGNRYRVKVMSYYDSTIYAYSNYFAIISLYNGSLTLTVPDSSATWTAGNSYAIQWNATGSPGAYVSLNLYQGSTLVSVISSMASLSSSYNWSLPAYLATGKYQIKLASYYDPAICDTSETFTISGMKADSLEPDNARGSASTLVADGSIQKHTLTYGDTDWVKFSAESGKTYLINNPSVDLSTNVYLYAGASPTVHNSFYGGTYSSAPYLTWTCDSTGTWYARVAGYYSSSYGNYTFSVTPMDSLHAVIFQNPTSASTWAAGTSYTVQWTSDPIIGSYVNIYLYSDSTLVSTIASYTSDDGVQSFTLPSSLSSGSRYRIKIADYNYSTLYSFSDYFTVSGLNPDTYEPDNSRLTAKAITVDGTAQSHSITLADSDWVKFNADSGKTYLIRVPGNFYTASYLYSGNSATYDTYLYGGTYTTSPYLIWMCNSTNTCYLRTTGYSSGYYGNYTVSVAVMDTLHLVSFTNPTAGATEAAGGTYSIDWTTDSIFSTNVYLYLYYDTSLVLSISGYTTNDGQYSWTIPSGLATGDKYRIKMTDYNNYRIYGYSPNFTISSGVSPDTYEPDNLKSAARSIGTDGAAQSRSIAYADTDWVSFTAKKDSLYLITALGTPYLYMYLYPAAAGSSYILYDYYNNPQIAWPCTTAGTYYVKVTPYSTSYSGSYSLSVKSYTNAGMVNFSSPTLSSTWSAGSSYSIQWLADTMLFSGYVNLQLYKANRLVMTIASYTMNDGLQTWTPTSGLASGSGYRIRMVNYNNTQIAGFSDSFTISGLTPDAYEPDDTVTQAHRLVSGTPENHSLTYSEHDWSVFAAKAGFVYKIETNGNLYTRANLYSTDKITLLSSDNSSGSEYNDTLAWYCPFAGDYYLDLVGSLTGAYALTLTEFDTAQYRFRVTAPVPADTFAAGNTCNVLWNDSLKIGGTVDLFLFTQSSSLPVSTIITSTPNDGSQAWVLPTGIAPRNDYYIKVSSRINSNIYGYSPLFSIK